VGGVFIGTFKSLKKASEQGDENTSSNQGEEGERPAKKRKLEHVEATEEEIDGRGENIGRWRGLFKIGL